MEEETQEDPWSSLHTPLLELIFDELLPLDLLRSGLVCRPWRAVSSTRPTALPLLLTFPPPEDRRTEACTAFSPLDGSFLSLRLPGSAGRRCLAAAHGWLLLADPCSGERFLLNPLSKARVDLPPWPSNLCPDASHAALSSPPEVPGCVVLLVTGEGFVFCPVGDDDARWSTRPEPDVVARDDSLIACNGKFYVVTSLGWLGLIEVRSGTDVLGPAAWLDLDRHDEVRWLLRQGPMRFPLEVDGEIWLVMVESCLRHYKIFRADMVAMAWAEVTDLGRHRRGLFLGPGCSFPVPAAGPVCHVYFASPQFADVRGCFLECVYIRAEEGSEKNAGVSERYGSDVGFMCSPSDSAMFSFERVKQIGLEVWRWRVPRYQRQRDLHVRV